MKPAVYQCAKCGEIISDTHADSITCKCGREAKRDWRNVYPAFHPTRGK